MSNNNWSAKNDSLTDFSYRANERNYTGIYLNHDFSEDIAFMVQNESRHIVEAINSDTEVAHTTGHLHQPEQNSEILPGPRIDIDDSNETPPPQLNSKTVEPVLKSYFKNNIALPPFTMDNFNSDPNMGNRRTQSFMPTSIQHSMPPEQNQNGQFSASRTVNVSQSNSSAFRPPDLNQYFHNNSTFSVQEHDQYSVQIPTSSSNRCESVIKYYEPTQNKFDTFNASPLDPRLINRDKNKYFEHGLDNFEGLKRISYSDKETYLNEDLRIINMKLKNMNTSYRFAVNDLSSDDNFNEHNIRRRGEPFKNTQTDLGAETYIGRNNYLKFLNTERNQKINFGKMFDTIHLVHNNGDIASEIEARRTFSILQKYRIEKEELRKSREDHQKKLAETVENKIDKLNDDTSGLRCSTETVSKKNYGKIKTHNLLDQTKNNVGKANKKTLTVENYNFDNAHKIVDNISGLIEANKNNKPLSEKSIEIIDLTNEDTSDVKINKNICTRMFTTKLKDPKIVSIANEQRLEKTNKSSENSGKVITNKTDKNKLINGPNGRALLGYETSNINKIRVKNTSQLIGNCQNEIINPIGTVVGEPCIGVQSNPNTSTKIPKSTTNVDGKIHHTHDALSIKARDTNESSESNFTNRSSSYKNHTSMTDLVKSIHDAIEFLHRDTNEDSLKSNTVQSLLSTKQTESATDIEEKRIGYPEKMSNKNSTKKYNEPSDSSCESNEKRFKKDSFENVDNAQSMSNTGNKNTDASKTDLGESSKDATQSQSADNMVDILPPIVNRYKSVLHVEKEVPYLKLSEQILNENSKSSDEYEFNYDPSLNQIEQSEDSDDEHVLTIDMQATDADEPSEGATESPGDCDGKSNDECGRDPEESADSTNFVENVLDEYFEQKKTNEGQNNKPSSEENHEKISEFIDDDGQLPNVQRLAGDDLPSEQPPADGQLDGEHFEMDYFYNIIKIKSSLFRVNLHNEDDIFNFIQLYSQRTQTNWRVLKSFKSRKYDVCKIFGCLHNSLFKLLKKQDKNTKINKFECRLEIDIKIKCSNIRGKKSDPYLKNGLPAIVRFKNNHNHVVPKATELPLLKSITDSKVKIKFDNGFDPSKILQAHDIGNLKNLNPSIVDFLNSSETDVEFVETNNLSTSKQIQENDFFSKWEDVKIQCDIVEPNNDEHLEPGQQVINNGDRNNFMCYQMVDTSYRKEYLKKVRGTIPDSKKIKYLSDKMATEEDQLSLYKCSGKKCNAVYRNWKTFEQHLNVHCHNTKNQKNKCDFMSCVYCFKSFDMDNVDELSHHIFDNYSFCKYFCRYCLYRAYTASHVLTHEFMVHKEQKPSILKLHDPADCGNSIEIVKMVDFKKFVLYYACNIGTCDFYTYLNNDFLNHLSHYHVNCDQFYCDICDKGYGKKFVSPNPTSFVTHFSLHNFNTYQCIFCLFGVEFLKLMIIHLAMEHFEYEPLCLERSPINNFCDSKNIENLKILNIKKCIPADIIKLVKVKSQNDLNKKERKVNEKRQANPADTCTVSKTVNIENTTQLSKSDKPMDWSKINAKFERFYNTCQSNKKDLRDTCIHTVEFDNTNQLSRRSIKEVVRPSKNTLKPAIGNKTDTIKFDEAKRNVSFVSQRSPNVGASIINNKRNSSQLSNNDIINNFKLKKFIGIPIKGKSLETLSSDVTTDQCMSISNKINDKVITAGMSYQDHLTQCPSETPVKCAFCLTQSESTFDVVEFSKLLMPCCFTCTFCSLDLPSTDIAKIHVKEVHNISNVLFVPLDFNATDMEKDRFLVYEDKCLKRPISPDDNSFYSEILKNMAITRTKRFKVENEHDDSQLTTVNNTTSTSNQQIKINPDESEPQHKTTKRKHSIESINNVTSVSNKKKPIWHKLHDTIPGVTKSMYYSPIDIVSNPQSQMFLKPVGCLSCKYKTIFRTNLMSHLKQHAIIRNENNIDDSILQLNTRHLLFKPNHLPQFVPKNIRFRCPLFCDYVGASMEKLTLHIRYTYHLKYSYYSCLHCKPLMVSFHNIHDFEMHLNFHGIDLYICLYCDYIHYDRLKIEAHQIRKHPFRIDCDNKFNIVAIRSKNPDYQKPEWKCKICMPGIKYTKSQISAHLSIVHKISNMYKCPMCTFNQNDYDALEIHFKSTHPSLEVKHMNLYTDKIRPDVELEPANKQTKIDKHASGKENHFLNRLDAFDSIAEPTPALHAPQGTLKSIVGSEDQGKRLDNPPAKLDDCLKSFYSILKYECPICKEFIIDEKESFREHLLEEINCTLFKCSECFSFSNSAEQMETHIKEHNKLKQKFEKIEISKKSSLIDEIIEYQDIRIKYELFRRNHQHSDCVNQNGTKSQIFVNMNISNAKMNGGQSNVVNI